MRCPFLREAQVKFCRASAHRKLILRSPGSSDPERCLSPEHATCPASKDLHVDSPDTDRCPFLHESLMQYCSAAPVIKYIPYSESLLSKCGTDRHAYCELFVSLQPHESAAHGSHGKVNGVHTDHAGEVFDIEGIPVPSQLWYAPNHCWMNIHQDASLHIGIDAFAAAVLGSAERISFVSSKGLQRPIVVLTVNGVDVQFVFPHEVQVTGVNSYLRSNPSRLFSDPYVLGWLFEGTASRTPGRTTPSVTGGLFTGRATQRWMEAEVQRMSTLAHSYAAQSSELMPRLAADGGRFGNGFLQHLTREETLRVVSQFFSPLAQWKD